MNIKIKLTELIEESEILSDCKTAVFRDLFHNKIKDIIVGYAEEKETVFVGSEKDILFLKSILPEDILLYQLYNESEYVELAKDVQFIVVYEKEKKRMDAFGEKVCILENELKKFGFTMVYGEKGICTEQVISNYRSHPYEEIRILKNELMQQPDIVMKKRILEYMIKISLEIKDFLGTFDFINNYIDMGFDKNNKYLHFRMKLELFLNNIKDILAMRKHNDIVLFWIDALEQAELQNTEFLKNYSNESLFFKRAYSFTPFTSASIKIVFDKIRQIEEKGFEQECFKASESILYKKIQNYGYDFNYFGLKGIADKIDVIMHDGTEDFAPGMIRLWDTIDYIINHDSPVFVIVHQMAETHMPWYGAEGEEPLFWASAYSSCGMQERELRQRRDAMHYLDRQLEYYNDFFDYPCTKIFFSDHGSERDVRYNEKNLNTILFIKSPYIKKGQCEKLVSAYQFTELMEFVFSPTEEHYKEIFNEHNIALFQDADVYNQQGVDYCLNHSGKQYGLAFRGAIGETDKYVCLGDQSEFYYILPDEETNHIREEAYAERIKELREFAGNTFINIYEEEKFEHSRRLYE